MTESSNKCPRCHRDIALSAFGTKRNGDRLRICQACINKNTDKRKRKHESIAVTVADFCQEVVSGGLNASVSIHIRDVGTPSPLREANLITKDDLLPFTNDLTTSIWQESNVRFVHKDTTEGPRQITLHYFCAQDESKAKRVVNDHRDRHDHMRRGPCESLLSFAYDRITEYLLITASHEDNHPPYIEKNIPLVVRDFIEKNVKHSPAQIYQMMLREPGFEQHCDSVSDSQVRYLWHNLTSRIWLRDKKDPLLSANLYANEVDRVKCLHLTCPGYEGLLIINKVATSNLSRPGLVQELVMDATYGTNSAAYSLFAILAEVDGTGIPLAYAFTKPIAEKARNTGAPLMEMLHQVLRNIREEGFYPAVFHCDKDNAEIKAITSIFPIARVQLCYWHVLRAIRSKLKSSTSTVGHLYDPQEAKNVIPELEICWGSRIDRRSTGHRPTDHCLCPSRNSRYTSPGRLEPSTVTERDAVLNLIHRHFNYHPFFPFQGGLKRNAASIRTMCASEMYAFCRERNWWRTWAYFWSEWYEPAKWILWARSAYYLLPVLKTTMVLESHWRVLKQDYLHQYNRPRMDLVVHCLVTEVMPAMDRKMSALLSGNQRIYKADWRREFKKAWLDARKSTINEETQHAPDLQYWVCSCKKFLLSRFLLCKHLIQRKELTGCVDADYFRKVRRVRTPPFWILPGEACFPTIGVEESPTDVFDDHPLDEELLQDEGLDSEIEIDIEPTPAEKLADLKATCAEFLELCEKEQEIGVDGRFVDKVLDTIGKPMKAILQDAKTKSHMRTMNKTWRPYNHPIGMFLNSC